MSVDTDFATSGIRADEAEVAQPWLNDEPTESTESTEDAPEDTSFYGMTLKNVSSGEVLRLAAGDAMTVGTAIKQSRRELDGAEGQFTFELFQVNGEFARTGEVQANVTGDSDVVSYVMGKRSTALIPRKPRVEGETPSATTNPDGTPKLNKDGTPRKRPGRRPKNETPASE